MTANDNAEPVSQVTSEEAVHRIESLGVQFLLAEAAGATTVFMLTTAAGPHAALLCEKVAKRLGIGTFDEPALASGPGPLANFLEALLCTVEPRTSISRKVYVGGAILALADFKRSQGAKPH